MRRSFGENGVKGTKGGHGRSVPMNRPLVALHDGLSQRDHSTGPDDWVLVDEAGGRVAPHRLRAGFYAALGPAGLAHLREVEPKLRWHDPRHSFASIAVKAKPISDVQAWLGHADVKTTQRYVHHVPAAADADALTAVFEAADGGGDPRRTPAGAPTWDGSAATERT